MDEMSVEPTRDATRTPPAMSVSELTRQLSSCVSHYFRETWVEGEVGKVREVPNNGRGNIYLTIKDDQSAIDAVIWARQRSSLKHTPKKGDLVRVRGNVNVNPKQGSCSLHIQHLEPTGQGLLLLQLEERRARLYAEGVFARALPLPRVPRAVALITSEKSDAEYDFLKAASKRAPGIPIYRYDARMQGEEQRVVQGLKSALQSAASRPDVDVLVITRGGGLPEHLWVFNNEELCRFIASAPLPVVVSIGHESNTLLAELSADLRCSTPTYAAMEVIPDTRVLRKELESTIQLVQRGMERQGARNAQQLQLLTQGVRAPSTQGKRQALERAYFELERAFKRTLDQSLKRFTQLDQRLEASAPDARLARVGQGIRASTVALRSLSLFPPRRTALEGVERELHSLMSAELQASHAQLSRLIASLHALSPLDILSRGYSITTRLSEATVDEARPELIDDASQLTPGDRVVIQLMRGRVEAEIKAVDPSWRADLKGASE